ncbi:MAG: abortive infection family protein [Candidatus Omnitrophica bacterium]|nr:abortive infection family protein [Candidatus Omnitrophota bacterium]
MVAPASATLFVMHGARDVLSSGLAHIEEQVRSIEQAVVENPALAFDLARTLIETVCRTILTERAIAYSEDDSLPKLFRTASNHLSFLPPSASSEAKVRKSLAQILSGLSAAIQGICELRNQCGFASHGPDKPRPPLESIQAMMAAEAADTIVGFLYRIHRQDQSPHPSPRALYEDNSAFNDFVDESFGSIRIFEIEFRASEILFQMEPESYRIYLAEFKEQAESAEAESVAVPEMTT